MKKFLTHYDHFLVRREKVHFFKENGWNICLKLNKISVFKGLKNQQLGFFTSHLLVRKILAKFYNETLCLPKKCKKLIAHTQREASSDLSTPRLKDACVAKRMFETER